MTLKTRDLKNLDLSDCDAPDEIPLALRQHAERMNADAMTLDASWQDRGAGNPWRIIATELERCAARIEKALP